MGREGLVETARLQLEDARRLEGFAVAIYVAIVGGGVVVRPLTGAAIIAIVFSIVLAAGMTLYAYHLRRRSKRMWEEALKQDPDLGEKIPVLIGVLGTLAALAVLIARLLLD